MTGSDMHHGIVSKLNKFIVPFYVLWGITAAPAASASVDIAYGPIADPQLAAGLKARRLGENLRAHLVAFAPKARFTLRIADCGSVNAFYHAGARGHEVRICTELVAHLIEQRAGQPVPVGPEAQVAGGAVLMIAGHELGHYMIHRYRIPFLGREEDVADQVGAAVILRSPLPRAAVWGAIRFFSRDAEVQDPGDVHSLDLTRRINLACWAYGTDPVKFADLANLIPDGRRGGCRNEAKKFWRGVVALQRRAGLG